MTTTPAQRTALVTGATSGLGLAAARLLADDGWGRIIVTGRTPDRAAGAAAQLAEATGRSVFEPLAVDLDRSADVDRAAAELITAGQPIDFLLLNAGMVAGSGLVHTDDGVEIMMSSSLVGHHRLTGRLVAADLLTADGRIVIAGSEAARGDLPTFNPTDLTRLAADHFGGDRVAAAGSLLRFDGPTKYTPGNQYATTKVFVAWWARELAGRLAPGQTVNAVSPGSVPDTAAIRNANFFMKRIMVPLFKLLPGQSQSVDAGAGRYLEAQTYDDGTTGRFFASAPRKVTGPLVEQTADHLVDDGGAAAAWRAMVELTGIDVPAPQRAG